MEIMEEFISGFCRDCNQGRTVTCEYEEKDGKKELLSVDCMYETCVHTSSCLVARQIKELLQ